MPKSKKTPSAEDFSDEEKGQIQRHGQALAGDPTDFDDEVEKELADHYPHEASAAKMHQAQTSGGASVGLGPTEAEQAQIKQRGALASQATTQGALTAAQAQAAQTPINAPPAPSSAAGTSPPEPYPAQRGSAASPGPAVGMPGPVPSAPPAAPGVDDEGEEEQPDGG
jgi:hypothetical protein